MSHDDPLIPEGGPRGKQRARLAVAAWVGVALASGWFLFRIYRGAVSTEVGDFNDFYFAAEALSRGADPYISHRGGYLYPPLVAWVLVAFVGLGQVGAGLAWGVVNVALTLVNMTLSVRHVARVLRGPCDSLTVGAVWLVSLALLWGPMRSLFEQGQSDTIVLLGLCAGLVLIDRLPWLAGFALGLALLVKHHVVVILAYLLVRGQWRAAMGMVAGGLVFAFLPALTLGFGTTASYLARSYGYVFRLFGGGDAPEGVNLHPITWELSISVTSSWARLFEGPRGVPMSLVALATLPVAAGVFGATWWVYRRFGVPMFAGRGGRRERDLPVVVLLEWCGVIIGLLAFSPQSIARHTYIMVPAMVLAAYVLLVKRAGATKWPLLAAVICYQLAAKLPPGEDRFEDALNAWRAVGGPTWFLLGVWLCLVWCTLSFARAGGPESARSAPDS